MDLRPPEVLLLQRVHLNRVDTAVASGRLHRWVQLTWRPRHGTLPRAPLGCFRRASVISDEVINQLDWD